MKRTGTVWKYGDHVDTDAIIPARYLTSSSPGELARHCMEDLDPSFAEQVHAGDLVVAGENFGCGSSREHAPVALKASGVSCVIASSYARIFYRNALNIGLPILVCPQAADDARNGHRLEVDLAGGCLHNRTLGTSYAADAFPPFILGLIDAGGLVAYTRRRLQGGAFDGLRRGSAQASSSTTETEPG